MDRQSQLNSLRENPTADVVVIGGGATGLGAALDSVTREYRTVLLEAFDFAKGTSSRSTKLIHGGVRYLRSGQVTMVRESLLERGRLLDNAPHVVHPMRFVVPAYKPLERWYYWFGMKLYDFLAGNLNVERSRMLSRGEALKLMPTMRPKDLTGGVLYSDGQFDDARLALSIAKTCVEAGGTVLNYCPVTGVQVKSGRVQGVTFQDSETGEEISIAAKVVINATGVFGESIMSMDPTQRRASRDSTPKIVPSQGTHVVLDRDFLPTDYGIMIPETDDGRVLFVIPWYGKTLVGTTDNYVEEKLPDPKPLPGEVDYLLEHAARNLTKTPTRSDVRSVFSGLRPLVGSSDKKASTASLSREHEIHVSPGGMISVIGGKWTTYRKMGEDVLDLASQIGRLKKRPSRTAYLPLVGAVANTGESARGASVNFDSFSTDPLSVFGVEQASIDRLITEHSDWRSRLHDRLPYTFAHVVHAVRAEAARTVEDVLARRTRALLLDAKAASESAALVAELMAGELGWDDDERASQVERFRRLAEGYQVHATDGRESV